MTSSIEQWLLLSALVATRLGGMLLTTPLLGRFAVPNLVKIIIVLTLAVCLSTPAMHHHCPLPEQILPVFALLLTEFVLGMMLALGWMITFSALDVAGRIMETQAGLGLGGVFDPQSQRSNTITASMLSALTVVIMYETGLVGDILFQFADLFQRVPLGCAPETSVDFEAAVNHMGQMFQAGIVMALGISFLLWVSDVGLAIAVRAIPQLNVLFLAFPIKLLLFLSGLALTLRHILPLLERMFAATRVYFDHVLY